MPGPYELNSLLITVGLFLVDFCVLLPKLSKFRKSTN